jgi:hypothetical protein
MVFTGDFEDDLANTMNSESNRRQAMRSVVGNLIDQANKRTGS